MHATALGLRVPPPAFPRRRARLGRGPAAAAVRAAAAASTATQRETDPRRRVVITGMGLASVFGNEVDAFFDRLLAGESGVGTIDRFDAGSFPTRFAGQIRGFSSEGYIDGKNDRRLDDCIRYCLVSGKKALEGAGLGAGSDAHSKVSEKLVGDLF
jgi:3-oxoacyl-[acyl-carrier-protein] synthase II